MEIAVLDAQSLAKRRAEMSAILVSCVKAGASVGFMADIDTAKARAFWAATIDQVHAGGHVVLVAHEGERISGTVHLVHKMPENQPHRAEVKKLLVDPAARRRGTGRALMVALEAHARELGKTLLTLDTARGSAAERLYRALGYTQAGVIPGYAL